MVAVEIDSSARNVEFYDDQGGYCSTTRGENLSVGDGENEEEAGPRPGGSSVQDQDCH